MNEFSVRSMASGLTGEGGLSFLRLLRSPLAQRITGVVFISILIVEAVILVPSYLREQDELHGQIRTTGLQWLSAAQPVLGEDADYEAYVSAVMRTDTIRGVRVLTEHGDKLFAKGEPIVEHRGVSRGAVRDVPTADGARFETFYAKAETGLPNDIIVRLDASHVGTELRDYVIRIIGLVLIITAVLTLATMLAMGNTVLRPLMQVRDALVSKRESQLISQHSPNEDRKDEIGEVYRSVVGILRRLGDSRKELEEQIMVRTAELRMANNQFQKGEDRFRDFAAASSDFLWEMDADLRFSYFSDRFTEVTGVPAEELLGKARWETRVPGVDDATWRAHLDDLHGRRPFRNFTHTRTRPDGTVVYLANSGNPIFDGAGNFQGYRGTGADITAAKEAERAVEESDARFRAMMDNSPSYIYLKDTEGRYQWVNKHVEAGLGLPAEEIIGKTHEDFYPPELTEIYAEHDREVIETKQAVAKESEVPEADGSIRTTLINKFPILDADNEVTGIGAVIVDITEQKESERALSGQKAILEATLEHMVEGITMFDEDNNLLASNSKVFELLDMPEDFCRQNPNIEAWIRFNAERGEFGPGDPEEQIRERMSRLNNFEAHTVERIRPNGQVIEVRANPVPQGGTVTSYTDVTERKRAEAELAEKEALLRLSLDNMNDGVFMMDADLNYIVFNDHFLELAELPADSVTIGGSVADVVERLANEGYYGPGDVEEIVAARMEVLANDQFQESEGLTKTGRTIHVRKAPLEGGGAVVSLTDISRHKEAEEMMRQARDDAEALARSKTDFVAAVSHEVRTPMNGVIGMARLLRDTELDGEQAECLDTLLSSGDSLVRILDDLLDVSKLEAGRFDLEELPFIPSDIIEQSVSVMAPRAQEKGLSFSCHIDPDIPLVMIGDGHRLRQVLLNLTSNAIKFTSEGYVTVVVEAAVDKAAAMAQLTVSVADSGDGIEPEVQKKLFTPYTQAAANVARKFGGTGLGLSICRQLVELMGGEIGVESIVGTGTTFTFHVTLPIDTETDVEDLRRRILGGYAEFDQIEASQPLKILQVEDNPTNREVAQRILAKAGHQVIDAENGLEALELVTDGGFDLVLMDRHMPEMDGFEATRAIRALEPEIGRLPILGVTAAAGKTELRACLDAGMDDVMSKPISERRLLSAIARLTQGDSAELAIATDSTVLVIDDVSTNLVVAEKQLRRLGVACAVTNSAEDGLSMLADTAFGAVLVDISMPGMDGLEFTAQVRARDAETGTHTPVIAMTGHAGGDDRKRFLDAGMDAILSKPILIGELAAKLQQALGLDAEDMAGPETAGSTDPGALPVIDLAKLADILGETDEDELIGLVTRFVDYFPKLLSAIEAAVDSQDAQDLQDQAHAAKGAAASAAAEALSVGLAELEKTAHVDGWDDHARRVDEVSQEFERVRAFLQDR